MTFSNFVFDETSLFCFRRRSQLNRFRQTFAEDKFFILNEFFDSKRFSSFVFQLAIDASIVLVLNIMKKNKIVFIYIFVCHEMFRIKYFLSCFRIRFKRFFVSFMFSFLFCNCRVHIVNKFSIM
jgi:hypothetical protein